VLAAYNRSSSQWATFSRIGGEIAMTAIIQTKPLDLTFEEFLDYDFGDDETRYELEDGEPIAMPDPSFQHENVDEFLADEFKFEVRRLKVPYWVRRFLSVKINVKTGKKPDVLVFPEAYLQGIDLSRPASLNKAPLLVVEVVSSGNWKNDYTKKKNYYMGIGVPEYWIADLIPKGSAEFLEVRESTVSVCLLDNGTYKVSQYRGDDGIVSQLFPELRITVNQLVSAGKLTQ
jgi:Uma2 family endonuclease